MIGPQLRVCVVGDELVAGIGDPRALGWAGRVAVRTRTEEDTPAVTVMPLGVTGEDSAGLRERWHEESRRRWDPTAAPGQNRLVIGLGHADAVAGLSLARSRLNLADVLDAATQASIPVFVVGPPPPADPELHPAVAELAHGWADVAQRRGVPFVDCFSPLVGHEQWFTDLETEDGPTRSTLPSNGHGGHAAAASSVRMPTVPGQVGYGLLAWLVLHGGWHRWCGITTTD